MLKIKPCKVHISAPDFLMLVIVLLPVLGSYSSGIRGITLGDVLLLIAEILCIPNVLKIKITEPIAIYILIILSMLGSTAISFGIQGSLYFNAMTRIVRILFYVSSVFFATSVVEYSKIKRIYMAVSVSLIIYILLQCMLFSATDVLLTNKILPIRWYSPLRATNRELAESYRTYYFRGTGFLEEPSYTGFYLMPGYCMSLCEKKSKKSLIKIGLFFCSILITTSLAAILIIAFCTLLYCCKAIFKRLTVKNLVVIAGAILAMVIALVAINRTPFGAFFNYRISHLLTAQGGSTSVRLFRGYGVWEKIKAEYKMFGIGMGNLDNYVKLNCIETVYDASEKTDVALGFVNALSAVVLYGGMLTFMVFGYLLYYLWRNLREEMNLILFFCVLMFASAGGIFDSDAVFYWSILFAGYRFQRSMRTGTIRLSIHRREYI